MESNQTKNDTNILIDLMQQNSIIYPSSNLIQKPLYDKLNTILENQWNFLQNIPKDQKQKIALCRTHNTILVSGKRGSGKTVFISNIENNIKENHYEFLDIIDPTLLSDSNVIDGCEAFCSILIGILHERVKEKVFKNNTADEQNKNKYTKKFREVAECLSSLKNAKDESGLDSIFFHGNAIALEQKLHDFFGFISETFLEKRMLCFRFDDIDMSFKVGFLCLETLRKYFSSPWVIPIVCGDSKLYQDLITKDYLKSFAVHDVKWEENTPAKMTDLAGQYLIKIFPHHLRLGIVCCADFVKQNYDQISFVFHGESKSLVQPLSLKEVDKIIDMYFNPGIKQDEHRIHKLSSCKSDNNSQSIVKDSLRVWIQFHEKMFPIYDQIVQMEAIGKAGDFDGRLYRQFQESLVDFFDMQKKYQTIADLARINVNSTTLTPALSFKYEEALTALSDTDNIPIPFEGQSYNDKKLCLSLPSLYSCSFNDENVHKYFLFLLQLFSFDNDIEGTGNSLLIFSGRFIHFIFSTLFQKDCDVHKILTETPPFSSFTTASIMSENDNEENIHGNLFAEQNLIEETTDKLWEEIISKYSYANSAASSIKPFFDVNLLQRSLSLYYNNLNDYRSRKYSDESIFDYMIRCVVILLHSIYTCERTDTIRYKMVGLTQKQNSFADEKKKISSKILPEISLLPANSVSYFLRHHPIVQLIEDIAFNHPRPNKDNQEINSCLLIDYMKKELSESAVRRKLGNASKLEEVNTILQIMDNRARLAVSKYKPTSAVFRQIKKLYEKGISSERSVFDELSKNNQLTNLIPGSPAWDSCVVDD